MNVLMLAPGYPAEMPYFTRGLQRVGASVIGLADQSESALPAVALSSLSAYLQVDSYSNEDAIVDQVKQSARHMRIDRVESQWEPLMLLAARIREALGLPGMTVAETVPFRDKERMKQVLDQAGIRTPHHYSATTASGVIEAAGKIGYPIIVKPIAGAGSADTHRVGSREELDRILPQLRHVTEVSVEEFIEADEFTYDTVCGRGRILYQNVCMYRPRPLIARQQEWISPQTVALRDLSDPGLQAGIRMGHEVIRAMNYRDGFTHMEWHRKADGEVVFGEIGARPPGARTVDLMNFVSDIDLFTGWAEAVCHGTLSQDLSRKYNCASIFKRAVGQGRIQRIEGMGRLMAEFGPHIVNVDLLPVGAPRRNWLQTLTSDGMVVVRHPDLETTLHIADRVGTDLQMYAG